MACLYKKNKGFSLLEMIVYVTILSAVFVLVVNTLLVVTRSYSAIKVSNDLNNSAMLSLNRLIGEIRQAKSIDLAQSVFDANPGRLVLNTTDNAGNPIVLDFYLDNEVFKISKDGVLLGSLTKDNVKVKNLIFRNLSSGVSSSVRTEIQFEASDRGNIKTENFYSFAVLRGSY